MRCDEPRNADAYWSFGPRKLTKAPDMPMPAPASVMCAVTVTFCELVEVSIVVGDSEKPANAGPVVSLSPEAAAACAGATAASSSTTSATMANAVRATARDSESIWSSQWGLEHRCSVDLLVRARLACFECVVAQTTTPVSGPCNEARAQREAVEAVGNSNAGSAVA